MPHAFKANPDHPPRSASPDSGGIIFENRKEAKRLAKSMKHDARMTGAVEQGSAADEDVVHGSGGRVRSRRLLAEHPACVLDPHFVGDAGP